MVRGRQRRRDRRQVHAEARPGRAPGACPCPRRVLPGRAKRIRRRPSNATRPAFAPCSRSVSATFARTTASTSARTPSEPRSTARSGPSCSPARRFGQEGLDFHPWCHRLVHWNLPGNPVDLEQREGRIHRYKGHAVRRNVAASHADGAFASWRAGDDIWALMFELADAAAREARASDLVPHWIAPGEHRVERHVPQLPYTNGGRRVRPPEASARRLPGCLEAQRMGRRSLAAGRTNALRSAAPTRSAAGSRQDAELRCDTHTDLAPLPQYAPKRRGTHGAECCGRNAAPSVDIVNVVQGGGRTRAQGSAMDREQQTNANGNPWTTTSRSSTT